MIRRIETKQAPKAIGPYSQGVVVEEISSLIAVSGQIPLDPETGLLVEGDIRKMTRRALKNLEAVLNEAGSGLDQVVRMEIFLLDMTDFQEVNEEYAKVFGELRPARITVQVAALPLNARIELCCLAAR